jgi:AcrR family transcriptional regulator
MSRERTRRGRERTRERRREPEGPIWTRPEPGSRRPRLSREQIAEAALAIADAEGFEAVSMRRVASELRAGTMTLYHYVRTKDDLIALMDDALMGEVLVPDDELPSDWREALTLIARRSRAAFVRHHWAIDAMRAARLGPNGMHHFEQSVAAVSGLEIDPVEKLEIITMVDDYVFGYTIREATPSPRETEIRAEWTRLAIAYIEQQLETGEFPHIRSLIPDEGGVAAAFEMIESAFTGEDRFERGLARLLDGIELDLERRRAGAEAR